MTALQIFVIVFWMVIYLSLSIASLIDALNGNFKFKNGVSNSIAAIWVAVTFIGFIVLTVYVFK
jgi:heme/copper-type cytochrome/quinol oxidase subunit 2